MSPELSALQKRAERERLARKQAEKLLEEKSLELYTANQKLKGIAEQLEHEVEQRTCELREALLATEKAAQAKGEFLAMISHEIRTPLNGILGTAELLDLSEGVNSNSKEYVQLIKRSGNALLAIINDILDFSKIEAGQMEMDLHPFQLQPELASVLSLYRPLAEEKNVALVADLNPALPETIVTDSTRLRQVIGNLVSNAIKFTHQGQVSLIVDWEKKPNEVAWLIVNVVDTGIGIANNQLERLFKPFSQADTSTTRKYGGTGLGLAISARIVEALGGEIKVKSKLGYGSTFFLKIPAPVGYLSENSTETKHFSDFKNQYLLDILLVEDNSLNQFVIMKLLEKLGCETDLAENGLMALKKVQENDYDVVMMDMQMPEMGGLEATQAIREMRLIRQPKIVGLTANAFESDRDKCFAVGMDGFITKPITIDALRNELDKVCLMEGK